MRWLKFTAAGKTSWGLVQDDTVTAVEGDPFGEWRRTPQTHPLKDVKIAHQEGYQSVEHLKRYTTLGMATDQGKLSNVNAIGLLAEARGVSPAVVGTTTFRPPFVPVNRASRNDGACAG